MKKVLALSLFFAILSFSASAQNEKNEGIRKQRIEQKLQHRNDHFKRPGDTKLRREVLQHRIMKQRAMRNKSLSRGEGRKMKMMQMQHRRKMMMRRHNMHRRVI